MREKKAETHVHAVAFLFIFGHTHLTHRLIFIYKCEEIYKNSLNNMRKGKKAQVQIRITFAKRNGIVEHEHTCPYK